MRHLFAPPEERRHGRQTYPTEATIAWTVIQVLAALASIACFCHLIFDL